MLRILRQGIEQAPIDGVLVPKLIDRADLGPLIGFFQVKHAYLRDVTVAADFVEVSVADDGEAWCTSLLAQLWKYGPFVCLNIVHLASHGALLTVPGTNSDDVSVLPRDETVGVSLVVHVCKLFEAQSVLVEPPCCLKVLMRVRNSAPDHIDGSPKLD